MSDFITPKQAQKTLLCPLARTFGFEAKKLQPNCRGTECACWRVRPLFDTDPGFREAIKKAQSMTHSDRGGKTPQKYVAANRGEFGLPTEPHLGYCGIGGRPMG